MNSSEQIMEDARRAGIDLDLLDTIQAQSVAQRWRQHDAALNLALQLKTAKDTRDAGLQHPPQTAD